MDYMGFEPNNEKPVKIRRTSKTDLWATFKDTVERFTPARREYEVFSLEIGNIPVPTYRKVDVRPIKNRGNIYDDFALYGYFPGGTKELFKSIEKQSSRLGRLVNGILTHQEFSLPIDAYEAGMKPSLTEFYKPNHTSPTNQ